MTAYTVTDTIRQQVTALQAGEALGLNPDRHGRCACPIHNGHDRNMKLWADDSGFYCYVCHEGGDVIRLVQMVQQCSFLAALEWLNSAFHLGLDLRGSHDKNAQEAAEMVRKRKAAERDRERAIDRMLYDCYVISGQLADGFEADAERYRPKRAYGDWPKEFCTAMRGLVESKELCADMTNVVIGRDNSR